VIPARDQQGPVRVLDGPARLVAEDIVVRFAGLVALDGVNVHAAEGQITGLIGPNGAGKTTLFNVCCGYQSVDAGRVYLDGQDVSGESPAQRARAGIGRTFQRVELFRSMTVRENVAFAAESMEITSDPLTQLGMRRGGRAVRQEIATETERVLDIVGLLGVADKFAGELPTGQGRLVELARVLARRPRVLLLDEPSSGLDAQESQAFGELLTHVSASRQVPILMVEHDMNLVLGVCDCIYVIEFGRPLAIGTPDEIRSSQLVREAYLGTSGA
jgi:ABC-type branched-subunit amino acid transport system ATPase component